MNYSSRFWLYAPISTFLLLAAAVAAYWHLVDSAVEKKLAALKGHEAIPGVTLDWDKVEIGGFPFRIDADFTNFRAAGAGVGAFFTPTGYGTLLAEGKETREINGRHYVLEYPIHADFALIKALRGDRWGNLIYRKTARNFGPIMATAAKCTIAQVREIVNLGDLDPEEVVTPGIFVQRVVEVPDSARLTTRPGAAA